ncbi:MAG: hypothetical protein PHZ07_04165 [Patescibacteria group bacterium]|nr:hypothetical protein [Patescibacteria group bacterium]MDD4304777.1 hypothetical protein [Patescibacteria group bacterium]MDD4695484.1 hypothetical protein [Patescibacteria group bacterium]
MLIDILIYFTITVITTGVVFLGIPTISTSIALIAGYYLKTPIFVGLSISIGSGIGSVLAQRAGQKFFEAKNIKESKLKTWIEYLGKKYQKYLFPFIVFISVIGMPSSWLLCSVAKDYSKRKIFIIQVTTRCIYFSFLSYCVENRIEIINIIQNVIK